MGSFVLLSEFYRSDAHRAARLGRPILERAGGHLDMVNDEGDDRGHPWLLKLLLRLHGGDREWHQVSVNWPEVGSGLVPPSFRRES